MDYRGFTFGKRSIKLSFTLIELVVVVIIIGILAGLAIPQYTRSREKTVDKQAQALLNLIRAAERTYQMELGYYYPVSGGPVTNINTINQQLNLDLIDDGNWNYSISSTTGFTAGLSRARGGYTRTWQIDPTMVNASCSGTCP